MKRGGGRHLCHHKMLEEENTSGMRNALEFTARISSSYAVRRDIEKSLG